ncbi:IS3 family transposase [Streptomyces sp. NPDC091280]|uniref:IS3 family transposase n=1 Tax=Streptomyces sp. NPDC091280 TaxID=3365984 RepID=UPI0038133534
MSAHHDAELVVAAPNMAAGTVRGDLPFGQGQQFRSRTFVRALDRQRMVGSIETVGTAGDKAAMESFFSLLQKKVLDRRNWTTRQEPRIAIVSWIERTYHRRRRQAAPGQLTPVEFETVHDHTSPPGRVTEPCHLNLHQPRMDLPGGL